MKKDPAVESETALQKAVRVGREAALLGFDWEATSDALEKVTEEVDELEEALDVGDGGEVAEELGDLLFAVCNVARKAEVEPEDALRAGVAKFERRFRLVTEAVRASGRDVEDVSLHELERIWQSVK